MGRHIVVVTNLKATRLRGELSHGMLLAAGNRNQIGVLKTPSSSSGMQITADGVSAADASEINIHDIAGHSHGGKVREAYVNGKILGTEIKAIRVDRGVDGKICWAFVVLNLQKVLLSQFLTGRLHSRVTKLVTTRYMAYQ